MKLKSLPLLAGILLAMNSFAQDKPVDPLPSRQVSGIVTDSAETAIPNALVKLTSHTDTLLTKTNEEGLFFFTNVKSWEFTLTVSFIGYRNFVKLGKYNDRTASLTMDPIILQPTDYLLKEVVIKGARPSIIYKTDTVEYIASDYVVREGASVGELLNKMEGMDVTVDGSLTYHGKTVDRARMNGKDFLTGDVATVTKNLPADLVEKVQIVDDYGTQAARNGIKTGEPLKVLNITTKADRSVGYFAKISGGKGNNARYNGDFLGTKLNANRNYNLGAAISNTINGVSGNTASTGTLALTGDGSSGGHTTRQGVTVGYRDQWNHNVQANMNYSYSQTNARSLNNSFVQDFSTLGTTLSNNERNRFTNAATHALNMEFESDVEKPNYIKVRPTLSASSTKGDCTSSAVLSGLTRQALDDRGSDRTQTPSYGLSILYDHRFHNRIKGYSIELSGSNSVNETNNEQNTAIAYFDRVSNTLLNDSLIQRSFQRNNLNRNYRANVTWSGSKLQFTALVNHHGYGAKINVNDLETGIPSIIDSLSNQFNYSFTEMRTAFGYRTYAGKVSLITGLVAVPTIFTGSGTMTTGDLSRISFNILPLFRLSYALRKERTLSVNYSGSIAEPVFEQVNPVRDVSNPQSPVIGNPDLQLAINHTLTAGYDQYNANTRFGLNTGITTTYFANRVTANIVQVADAYNSFRYERYFSNVNGTYQVNGRYTLTKAVSNRKYNFTLGGNVNYAHTVGLSNTVKNTASQWAFTEKLGLKASPKDGFELNSSVAHSYSKTAYSLPGAFNNKIYMLTFQVEGRNYFRNTWLTGYNVTKNYVQGINSNVTANPFIVNLYLEREFLKRRSAKVRFQVFDLFNQNNFLNRMVTETRITEIRSNLLSRFYMVSLNLNLQRFKGTPERDGVPLRRRGDGSFIY